MSGIFFVNTPQQKTRFCLPTKVRFLNDVCQSSLYELYGKMMLALPMMTATPNDAWLRHILWQTSHHPQNAVEQHYFERSKNIISPQAMHHLTYKQIYSIITLERRCYQYNKLGKSVDLCFESFCTLLWQYL